MIPSVSIYLGKCWFSIYVPTKTINRDKLNVEKEMRLQIDNIYISIYPLVCYMVSYVFFKMDKVKK